MSSTVITPEVLSAIDTFKKAESRITGAITTRTNAQKVQSQIAYAVGPVVLSWLAEAGNTLDLAEQAFGLDRAKVARIGYMARVTKGLESVPNLEDEKQEEALRQIWLTVSGSKGLKAEVMDRLGATPTATVEALADKVKAAKQSDVTLPQVLKALKKAAEGLQNFDLSAASEEEVALFEEAFDLIALFDGTREAEAA